jgi:hypothetical protein
MKIISRKVHGYLDYIVAVLLISAPWIFNFYMGGAETWVPVILGISTIIYSLMTDYELGAIKIIPMNVHLIIDAIAGILLIASPWIFNFNEYITTPHIIAGVMELLIVSMTVSTVSKSTTEHSKNQLAH